MTFLQAWRFATLMLTSFSLSLSMAHLMELPRRIQFDRDLWVRVTVFENVYRFFGSVGAVFEVGSVLMAIALVYWVRDRGASFYWTLGGASLLALALLSWIAFVAPVNAELANWLTHPVPADWNEYRNRWEYAHAVNAVIKIVGVGLLVASVIIETPQLAKRREI